jgi:hypothetical protein
MGQDGELGDPAVMKALAHPTRIALIEALHVHTALTATEASAVIGETPTNCAFHLRTLARYRIVEAATTGPGRRRAWRLTSTSLSFSDVQPSPEGEHAAQLLAGVLSEHWLNRVRARQQARNRQPKEWQDVLGGTRAVVVGTPEEIRGTIEEIRGMLARHNDRLHHPSDRPTGAQPIEFILFVHPFSSEFSSEPAAE